MFANYNYNDFPIVKVDLSGNIENNEDFLNFTNQWLQLYNKKQEFEFIFDTYNCGLINPKYCLYTALFIKKIKQEKIQYLKKSIIYVYNKYIFHLLKIIFYIEKPVAPIDIIFNDLLNNSTTIQTINN
jgi:hypothetical protein|tara:strand:- start:3114 stop:3497 length:384 start_codon:yes stop_codon:yes gene_type:complete